MKLPPGDRVLDVLDVGGVVCGPETPRVATSPKDDVVAVSIRDSWRGMVENLSVKPSTSNHARTKGPGNPDGRCPECMGPPETGDQVPQE